MFEYPGADEVLCVSFERWVRKEDDAEWSVDRGDDELAIFEDGLEFVRDVGFVWFFDVLMHAPEGIQFDDWDFV